MEKVILLLNDELHKHEPVEFTIEHASNLLKLQREKKFTDFTLPTDSEYILETDGLIKRAASKATNIKTTKQQ